MNYRHAFHAGNHADLLKHALLDAALRLMSQKPKPLVVVDAFAGAGLYDLRLDERADRTGEWRSGVDRLWARGSRGANDPLAPFLSRLAEWNPPDEAFRWYPGSPALALAALRAEDKLLAVEKHPEEAATLRARVGSDRRARIYAEDGWAALRSFLPPTPRRGLVIIDPPYEAQGEFERLAAALSDGLRRWAAGVFLLWYPIKTEFEHQDWAESLEAASGAAPLLQTSLMVRKEGEAGLIGSGLAIANPPFGFDAVSDAIGAEMSSLLTEAHADGFRQTWLRAPR